MTHNVSEHPLRRAVVIGAGVAGLAAAGLLSRDGYDVIVLEKEDQVGGRAGVLVDEHFRWDMGPSWWLMPEAFEHFYHLFDTTVEAELDLVYLNDPAFRVFTEGSPPLDVHTGRQNIYELFELIEPGSGPAIERYLRAMETSYRLAIEHFLYTNFTQLRALATPDILSNLGRLLRSLVRSIDTDVTKRFRDTRLRQLLSYAAVFLSSAPTSTPALYGILNYTTMIEGVAYPMGGFATFVESLHRLAIKAGATIQTGAEVRCIEQDDSPQHSRRRVSGVLYRDATGEHRIEADVVVSCADRQHTESQLLADDRASRPKYWRRRNPGMSCVLAYLGVAGSLPELAHHSLIFSRDWDADFAAVFNQRPNKPTTGDRAQFSESLYLCCPSATDPSVAPADHENLFVLIPVPAMADGIVGNLNHAEDDEVTAIVDAAIALVASRTGITDLAQRIVKRHTVGPGDFQDRFNAWQGNALGLAHTLSQSAFLRGSNTSKYLDGLYFAGATTVPGVGLPMCLISAENVVKRLRDDASTGPLHAPLRPVTKAETHNR